MYTIVVCDDDSGYCKYEAETIQRIARVGSVDMCVEIFTDSTKLPARLRDADKSKIDILIMDIDMPDMDGYYLADVVKNQYPDILLIFASNQEQLVFQAFEYRPFRFVRKSHFDIEMRLALRKAVEELECHIDREIVLDGIVNEEKVHVKIHNSNIKYFMLISRRVILYLDDDSTIEVRNTIKGMMDELQDERFICISSGCVINSAYISSYSNEEIKLKSGECLPISRSKLKDVQFQIKKEWG